MRYYNAKLVQCISTACCIWVLAGPAGAFENEAVEPAGSPEHPLVSFLKDGKVNLDVRFRYEHGDVAGLGSSNAFTMRTRLGYTTAVYQGFQAMVELEDNRAADDDEYFDGIPPNTFGLSPIVDPEDTELNQLWVAYDLSALSEDLPIAAKIGRQRVNLDDQRFIGSVSWRNLEQTLDAGMLTYSPTEDLKATYLYIDEVNRIFGSDSGLDFNSESHAINVAYSGLGIGKVVGFAYLLDLGGTGTPGAAVSSQTYGARLEGLAHLNEDLALGYIGSFAWQSDYANNATSYDAFYILTEGKIKFKKIAGAFIGGGFEMLGSDNGTAAFSTPLATLHKFNGFADSFLATPAAGLRDYYAVGGFTIPGMDVDLMAAYHEFTADDTSADLGNEIDLVLKKKLNEHASVLLKYAHYDGDSGRADIYRFWLQLDLKF